MKKLLGVITLVLVAVALVACGGDKNEAPTFAGVGPVTSYVNVSFDPLEGVTATDKEDGDLTDAIVVVSNNVNIAVPGTYSVRYEVKDSKDKLASAVRTVTVAELDAENVPLAQYLSGVDLSKLPAEDKDILFAAAEDYLLENVYAGVPLYTGATRVMYSNRVQLFSPNYNGVLGFGTAFSQFTEDDSKVIMFGSTAGNVGEYTWRATYSTDPTTLNQWISDDSSTSDFIDLFTGSLYDFYFDETKTGYEILPSLAAAEPVPVNPTVINGKVYAKTWQIQVRDGLTWKYHPSTDLAGMPSGHEVLNAEDFLWTWRHALEQKWFRARTGGGDFVGSSVKGAADYLSGTISLDEVGLRLAAGKANTLEIEYINEKSAFDVKYQFSSTSMSPVNQQLLNKLTPAVYGTTPQTVPSSGIYYFETWTPGQLLVFKKNTLHPQSAMYYYTGQQFRFMSGSDLIFQEFLEGRLESASVPASRVTEFASDPRVKVAPAATTWRLVINSFGTEANRDAYIASHPNTSISNTFIPEPILMYKEMRQALYFGFDRYEAAVNVVKTYLPAYTLFASTYFLDGESGMSVRTLPAGAAILQKYGAGSYGFVPDAAVALFESAVTQAIAAGYYQKGTASNYTVIELGLTYASSGNTAAQAMIAQIKQQYESRLVDTTNFVRIQINVADVAFPGNYYDFMMKANTDLGIGGISGSLLDAPSFLDVFADDNRGAFTLSWGIDTSTPNIAVAYRNLDGVLVTEKWSYNALVAALNGKTYVRDGVEQKAWTIANDLVAAYLDMAGEVLDTVAADTQGLAGYIVGDLEDLAEELGVDSVEGFVAVTESGKSYLFIVKKTGFNYELHQQLALATNARDAVVAHNSGYSLKAISENPLTLEELNAIPYIASTYGAFASLDAVWTTAKVPAGVEAFVYSTQFNTYATDAYVVIKVGAYYIGWMWL